MAIGVFIENHFIAFKFNAQLMIYRVKKIWRSWKKIGADGKQ